MSLLALITALLLEQFHPLSARKHLNSWLFSYVNFFKCHFDAGEYKHGKISWFLAILPLLIGVTLLSFLLHKIHPIFSFLFNVFALYLTFGFHQFSSYFTDIQIALRADKLDEARKLLTLWRDTPMYSLNAGKVAQIAIEEALLTSHRKVFGIVVWFAFFSAIGLCGAAGALLYRLGQLLHEHWTIQDVNEPTKFGRFAQQAYALLEWLPARTTALTFTIVGNFEDTLYCWRTQVADWPNKIDGIVLASGAGSLGVRLGMPIQQGELILERAELGLGDDADVDYMKSTIGLLWRSLIFMLIMILLFELVFINE